MTAFPRTDPLEAKDQGHSRKCFSKTEKKSFQKSFSGNLQFIGVAKIFDWGWANHKSHAMMSSQFSKKELSVGQRYRRIWKI